MDKPAKREEITREDRLEALLRHIAALLGGKRCKECVHGYRCMRWSPDERVYNLACEECGGSGFEPLPTPPLVRAERAEAEASMWRKKFAELERARKEAEAREVPDYSASLLVDTATVQDLGRALQERDLPPGVIKTLRRIDQKVAKLETENRDLRARLGEKGGGE